MGVLNFPVARKLWSGNIAAKKAHGVGMPYSKAFGSLFVEWDWDGWIKRQIDLMLGNGVGCNCVRLLGDLGAVHAGIISQADYNAHWQQLIEYVGGLGGFVHLTTGWSAQISAASIYFDAGYGYDMTDAQIYGAVNTLLAALPYDNLVAVDLIQEANNGVDFGLSSGAMAARCIAVYNGAHPNTSLPLGHSCNLLWTGSTCRSWIASIADGLDFLDFHIYANGGYSNVYPTPVVSPADLGYWRSTYPSLDLLLGEFGSPQSASADTQAWHYESVLNTANVGDPRVRGGGPWAGLDGNDDPTDMWGLYANDGTPRLDKLRQLRRYTGGYLAARA